jgi:hypothetical protein
MMIALDLDKTGQPVLGDRGPMLFVSSTLVAWVEGASVKSGPGARLIDKNGETLGYVACPASEVATMINDALQFRRGPYKF